MEFSTNKGHALVYHRDVASGKSITKYTKVKGEASPFDGNTTYWTTRLTRGLNLPQTRAKLMEKCKGKCA